MTYGPWMVSQTGDQTEQMYGELKKKTDPSAPLVRPELDIVHVNLIGTMYTWKLVVHYFRKQPDTADRDRCFIMTGSMVAWIDSPVCDCFDLSRDKSLTSGLGKLAVHQQQVRTQGIDANCPAEFARTGYPHQLRGAMVSRALHLQGSYLTTVSYIKSAIRSAAYEAELVSKGVEFAPPEDVALCMMKLATDRTINGVFFPMHPGWKTLTHTGHSLMITPRSVAKEGFMDVGSDDHVDEGYMKRTQEVQLKIIEDKWEPGWGKGRTAEGAKKEQ